MGDDFLPVGIRVSAEGVDTFLSQLGKVQAGVTTLGKGITTLNTKMASSQGGVTAATGALARLQQSTNQTTQSTTRLRQATQGVTTTIGNSGSAWTRLGMSISQTTGKTQQYSTSLTVLKARENALIAEGARLKQAHTALRAELDRLTTSHTKTVQGISEAKGIYDNSVAASARYRIALAALNKKYGEGEVGSKTLTAALVKQNAKTQQAKVAMDGYQGRLVRINTQLAGTTQSFLNVGQAISRNNQALSSVRGFQRISTDSKGLEIALLAQKAVLATLSTAWKGFIGTVKIFGTVIAGTVSSISRLNSAFKGGVQAVKKFVDKLKAGASQAFRMGNSIRFLGTSITFLVSLPAIGFLKTMTTSAIDFEDAFAGVIRTVDQADFRLLPEGETNIRNLTETGLLLQKQFRNLALEIPISAVELAKLGEVAGTLGVRGVANLTKFVDTTARIGVSTNVSAEEAARGLGKIIGVAGGISDLELRMQGFSDSEIAAMSETERFSRTLDALGGSLVALGNKTIAQEDEILSFALEIAGSGDVMGITASQLLAIGSAFTSVGVQASRGRTAFQKTMFAMLDAAQDGGRGLDIFAAVSNQTLDEWQKGWEGDRGQAFVRFISGLGKTGDEASAILQELGLGNDRVKASLLSLASAEGTLANASKIVNEELLAQIDGMSALELESARRFSTTASQLQLLKNQYNELGIVVGSVVLPELNKLIIIVRGVLEKMTQLSPIIIRVGLALIGLVAIIGPIITGMGLLLASIGFIIQAGLFFVSTILSIVSAVGLLLLPLAAIAVAFTGLAIALAASITTTRQVAGKGFGDLARAMFQFGKNIILSFARGMARAAAAIITVLNQIGRIITNWLKPGSPPKLLPDLDIWGTGAMQSYIDGWLKADFDVFNNIADKIEQYVRTFNKAADDAGKAGIIQKILGSRKAIKEVVNEFKKTGKVVQASIDRVMASVGAAGAEVRLYVKSLLELELASQKVKEIQDQMTAANKKYAASLKPIEDRLKQIKRRQDEVSDALRIGELEAILADPRAPELVRELANLELEQIDLEGSAQSLEDQRDAELAILSIRLETAQLEMDAAKERFDSADALLDMIMKERDLMNELIDIGDKAASKISDALSDLGSIIGDIDPEVDTSGLDDFGGDLTATVASIIAEINAEFTGLITDLGAIFDPLTLMWEELGNTWAGIFDGIFGPLGEWLGVTFKNPFENYILPTEQADLDQLASINGSIQSMIDVQDEFGSRPILTDQHLTDITEFGNLFYNKINPAVGEFLQILIDLGLIDPTGKLGEHITSLNKETEPSKLSKGIRSFRDAINEVQEAVKGMWVQIEPVFKFIGDFFTGIANGVGDVFSTIDFAGLSEAFTSFSASAEGSGAIDFLIRFGETVVKFFTGILILFSSIGIIIGGFIFGIINGIVTAITALLPFFGNVLSGIEGVFLAIGTIWEGIKQVFSGDFMGGLQTILDGVTSFIGNFISTMANGLAGAWAFLVGFFVGFAEGFLTFLLGFLNSLHTSFSDTWASVVQGILDFVTETKEMFEGLIDQVLSIFQKLYDRLVGNSIVPDMIDGIKAAFEWLWTLPAQIFEWVQDILGKFVAFAAEAITWATDLAGSIISGLVDGLKGGIDAIVGAAGDVASSIKDGIKGFLGINSPSKEMKQVGEDTIDGLVDGLDQASDATIKVLEELVDTMLDTTSDALKMLVMVFQKAFIVITDLTKLTSVTIISLIETSFKLILTMATTTMQLFLQIFKRAMEEFVLGGPRSIWGVALETFVEMFVETFELFIKTFEVVIKSFLFLMSNIAEAVRNAKPALYDAGVFIMQGLQSGLESMRASVVGTARSIANEAADAVNNAVGNSSPSKVFAEIGENIMEGWRRGLLGGQDAVTSALDSVASRLAGVQAGGQLASMPVSSSGPVSAPPVTGYNSVVNNNQINLGGQQFSEPFGQQQLQILVEQALRKVVG